MDLYLIWRLIIRHLPVVLVTSLVGLLFGLTLTLASKPLYSATSEIFVSTPAAVLDVSALAQGSNFTQQRVKSYAQLVNAEGTLNPVISQLKLDTTAVQLAKQIRATVPVDTVIIDINVKDRSPVMAVRIANAVAQQFSISVQQLELPGIQGETSVKASLSREATVPTSPVSPNLSLNIAVGLLLGFGIGFLIAIAIHFGDLTVKNADHLQGLQLLGTFKFEKSAKVEPLVSKLNPYDARTEEYRQLRTSVIFQTEKSRSSVLAVTSALPVEGKTTTSLNLAYSLKEAGYQVLLMEVDMRRPQIAQYTDTKTKPGTSAGLSNLLQINTKANLAREIKSKIYHDKVNQIDIIFAGPTPNNPTELLANGNLIRIIQLVRKKYDYVILDCPPVLPIADTPALSEVADEFLLVVRAGTTRIQQFKGTAEILQNVNAKIMGVILNMIPVGRKSDEYGYQYGSYRAYGYNSSPSYAPRDADLRKNSSLKSGSKVTNSVADNQSERTPRYEPKFERTPRYEPKSERTPRYEPKSERTPRYEPKSERKIVKPTVKNDDFDNFVSQVLMSQEPKSGSKKSFKLSKLRKRLFPRKNSEVNSNEDIES